MLPFIDLTQVGLNLFAGPLEAAILRAIWHDNHTVPEIYKHVLQHYKSKNTDSIAHSSVSSTVHRMYKLGHLTRAGDKTLFSYHAIIPTEQQFIEDNLTIIVSKLLDSFPKEFGRIVINQLKERTTRHE